MLIVLFVLITACAEEGPKATSESGEKLYPITGTILSRNPAANTVMVDHDAIPGFMEAMKMEYAVRGADVETLPPDGSRFEATVHVTERSYWLTDVKPAA